MYLHVRFPQEFHPKKKVLWYLFKVYVENEAMSSIYRGRFVMDSKVYELSKFKRCMLNKISNLNDYLISMYK
jgi:hypothetical protein